MLSLYMSKTLLSILAVPNKTDFCIIIIIIIISLYLCFSLEIPVNRPDEYKFPIIREICICMSNSYIKMKFLRQYDYHHFLKPEPTAYTIQISLIWQNISKRHTVIAIRVSFVTVFWPLIGCWAAALLKLIESVDVQSYGFLLSRPFISSDFLQKEAHSQRFEMKKWNFAKPSEISRAECQFIARKSMALVARRKFLKTSKQ